VKGPQHDEDHDGAYDACDSCPVNKDPACVPPSPMIVFDPFTTADGSQYVQGSGVAIGPEQLELEGTIQTWVLYPHSGLNGAFVIGTHVEVEDVKPSGQVGVLAVSELAQPWAVSVACVVVKGAGPAGDQVELQITTPGGTAPVPPAPITTPSPFDLLLVVDGTGGVTCQANDVKVVGQMPQGIKLYGGVVATEHTRFDWYLAYD
jgi:hypothetical protein